MKKFLKSAIMLVCICVGIMAMGITAFAVEGDGSEETPFLITNQEELELINDFPDCNFKLMNDIVLEGEWVPLCQDAAFSGTLDGSGYTISELYIDTSYANTGFIAASDGATIKNISIETTEDGISHIESNISANIGVLVAECYNSQILNCNTRGNIEQKGYVTKTSSTHKYIGGMVGIASNTLVKKCKIDVSVTNTQNVFDLKDTDSVWYYYYYHCYLYTGGIVGRCRANSKIEQCVAEVNAEFNGKYCSVISGGIVGELSDSTVQESYYKGFVNTTNMTKGGGRYSWNSLLGITISGGVGKCAGENTLIENCYAVGSYNDTTYKYGFSNIVGTSCFYDKTVSGLTDTAYGTPKSTSAMKMKKTYTDAGWDFDGIWAIDSNYNDGYPYLQFEYAGTTEIPEEVTGEFDGGDEEFILGEGENITISEGGCIKNAIIEALLGFIKWGDSELGGRIWFTENGKVSVKKGDTAHIKGPKDSKGNRHHTFLQKDGVISGESGYTMVLKAYDKTTGTTKTKAHTINFDPIYDGDILFGIEIKDVPENIELSAEYK